VVGSMGRVRGRRGRPRCVPGVSWRPRQGVAATRRPGREGSAGKSTKASERCRGRHRSSCISPQAQRSLPRPCTCPHPGVVKGTVVVGLMRKTHGRVDLSALRGGTRASFPGARRSPALSPNPRPSRPRPHPARVVAGTAASLPLRAPAQQPKKPRTRKPIYQAHRQSAEVADPRAFCRITLDDCAVEPPIGGSTAQSSPDHASSGEGRGQHRKESRRSLQICR